MADAESHIRRLDAMVFPAQIDTVTADLPPDAGTSTGQQALLDHIGQSVVEVRG